MLRSPFVLAPLAPKRFGFPIHISYDESAGFIACKTKVSATPLAVPAFVVLIKRPTVLSVAHGASVVEANTPPAHPRILIVFGGETLLELHCWLAKKTRHRCVFISIVSWLVFSSI